MIFQMHMEAHSLFLQYQDEVLATCKTIDSRHLALVTQDHARNNLAWLGEKFVIPGVKFRADVGRFLQIKLPSITDKVQNL